MRKKIKHIIQSIFGPKMQIVYIKDEYCVKCLETSRETSDSYSYQYTKPSLVVTADDISIPADKILKAGKSEESLVQGLWGEIHNSYSAMGARDREYIMHISEEACPLKIKYSSGSGEGYNDSEYWSSDRKEYWVSYISDNKK